MPVPSLRDLINWRLLALHQLAVFCLVVGVRKLWLVSYADILRGFAQYGPAFMERPELHQQYRLTPELLTDLLMREAYAYLAALAAGCALSWLVVARRRERRAIPLLVFLISTLLNWHDVYDADWLWAAVRLMLRPLPALHLETRLGLTGAVFVLAGLLLFAGTWPARRPTAAAGARP